MTNEIMTGISRRLSEVFGEKYEIYGDTDIVQGLHEPCFFIAVLSPFKSPLIGSRSYRCTPFDVQFFAENEGDNAALHDTADKLFEVLEYITLLNGDILRGTSMSYETVSGVLHFFVSYNMVTAKQDNSDNTMNSLTTTANVIRP